MLHQLIIEHVVMPGAESIVSAPFYRHYKSLMRSQFLGADELHHMQTEKFLPLVKRALKTVPFYREFARRSNCEPDDFRTLEDIKRLPVVTKDTIRGSALEDWIADDVPRKRWRMNSTSGSTGKPFQFVMDGQLVAVRYGRYLRANAWAGMPPGAPCLRIWGLKPWYQRIGMFLVLNLRTLSAFDMTDAQMERYVRYLRTHKIPGIEAYASGAVTLAKYILRRGYDDVHVPLVATAGETSFLDQRRLIEQAFHCRVLSRYGCREFGLMAQQCPEQKGLHINQESFVLEFLDTDQPWVDGISSKRIVITNLDNQTMPFLRYQIGDLGLPLEGSCPCGRQLPLMDHPEGRVVDYLQTPEGKTVSVHFFTLLFGGYTHAVREFQIRQKDAGEITVRLVPAQGWRPDMLSEMEQKIRRHLGRGVRLTFDVVQEIPLDASGKRKILVNEMALGATAGSELSHGAHR